MAWMLIVFDIKTHQKMETILMKRCAMTMSEGGKTDLQLNQQLADTSDQHSSHG
jgi:hypothetical protein